MDKEFKPNVTPREMFRQGSFGGTYWRPIYSTVTKKHYKNMHSKFPKSWWANIPDNYLSSETCNPKINKYKVNVGTSLQYWESKDWITKYDPYGWVQWYCNYTQGRRTPDDERQIKRWLQLAGPKGRFRLWLITQIQKKNGKYNDMSISPKIRQTLLHWGYQLTEKDFNKEIASRKASKK